MESQAIRFARDQIGRQFAALRLIRSHGIYVRAFRNPIRLENRVLGPCRDDDVRSTHGFFGCRRRANAIFRHNGPLLLVARPPEPARNVLTALIALDLSSSPEIRCQ